MSDNALAENLASQTRLQNFAKSLDSQLVSVFFNGLKETYYTVIPANQTLETAEIKGWSKDPFNAVYYFVIRERPDDADKLIGLSEEMQKL